MLCCTKCTEHSVVQELLVDPTHPSRFNNGLSYLQSIIRDHKIGSCRTAVTVIFLPYILIYIILVASPLAFRGEVKQIA